MNTVFLCGIGGIGMSALARYYKAHEYTVFGSDNTDSDLLSELENEGITVFRKQSAQNIPQYIERFIYSEAIPENHSERLFARKNGIPEASYFEALGDISRNTYTIAIAGTHGKSSTTVMIALALEKAGIDPTVLVGTKVFEWGNKNFRDGKSDVLVIEACEYRESFLYLDPDSILLTNVEPEHLDYYGSAEKYFRGFEKFIGKLGIAKGMLVADFTDEIVQRVAHKFTGKEIFTHDLVSEVPQLQLKGEYHRQNAAKVLGFFIGAENLAPFQGKLDIETAKGALKDFKGSWRRFEYKGEKNSVTVIDDYGHHPTELKVTLEALSQTYPDRKKWVVFQPHQYSRTYEFLEAFGKSFANADEVLIPNIYRVRDSDEDVQKVSPQKLVEEIQKNISASQQVRYTENFEGAVQILRNETKSGDVVLTIGAGPVHEVGERFLHS